MSVNYEKAEKKLQDQIKVDLVQHLFEQIAMGILPLEKVAVEKEVSDFVDGCTKQLDINPTQFYGLMRYWFRHPEAHC